MVGFGLDYACAHIINLAEISSLNLLTERVIRCEFPHFSGFCASVCLSVCKVTSHFTNEQSCCTHFVAYESQSIRGDNFL